jgi:hypothetical protein
MGRPCPVPTNLSHCHRFRAICWFLPSKLSQGCPAPADAADSQLMCGRLCVLSLIVAGGSAESIARELVVVRSPAGTRYAVR